MCKTFALNHLFMNGSHDFSARRATKIFLDKQRESANSASVFSYPACASCHLLNRKMRITWSDIRQMKQRYQCYYCFTFDTELSSFLGNVILLNIAAPGSSLMFLNLPERKNITSNNKSGISQYP